MGPCAPSSYPTTAPRFCTSQGREQPGTCRHDTETSEPAPEGGDGHGGLKADVEGDGLSLFFMRH